MAVKTKNEYNALKKDIADKNIGNLYIICGEENYLKEFYLNEMKKVVLGEGSGGFNYKKYEGKSLDMDNLYDAVEALPSFSERTFVEIRDFDIYKSSEDTAARLSRILSAVPEYCCLVFIYDLIEFKQDRRRKIHSIIDKNAKLIEIPAQEQSDLINWILRRVKHGGKTMKRENAEYLIHYCGNLMTGLIQELEKLIMYATEAEITRSDIEAVTVPITEAVAFNLADAVAVNNIDKAADILARLFQLRESPIMLLGIIGSQLRKLYMARHVYEAGKNASHLKELLSLRSDYQARVLMENAARISLHWCRMSLILCAETDFRMKSSSPDDDELLTDLLLRLAGDRVR